MPMCDYKTVKTVGSGGFGDAFLVELKSDRSKQFVLKAMKFSTRDERMDCEAEVEMLQHLEHPHVVQFIESFTEPSTIYLVMEFCAGGDMAQLIEKQSKRHYFSEEKIIFWVKQILEALQYLHGRTKPVLHRDMKPANIFLTTNLTVKIGDFGISRELEVRDLATTMCGTPLYLSPEIFRSLPYDSKCDIWSLGCCVYEMMTFKTAINPLLLAALNMVSLNPMPTDRSPELTALIKEMLQEDPNLRPSASEAFDKLQQIPCNPRQTPAFSSATGPALNGNDDDDDDDDNADYYATRKGFEVIDSIVLNKNRLRQQGYPDSYKDPDETIKAKDMRRAAPVLTPEKVLKYYGYHFNSVGVLLDIKTGTVFKYNLNGNRKHDEIRYQAIADAVTGYVHGLLERDLKMQKIYIPLDYRNGEPCSFVYATCDLFTNPDKLLILIGGSEPVRAGVWSRREIINDCLDAGSQIPCIKRAIAEGYAVLVLNQNQTYLEVDGFRCEVRESHTPSKHALYVWDKLVIANTKAKHIAFFTHTGGGQILAELAANQLTANKLEAFNQLVFGMALCHFRDKETLRGFPEPVVSLFEAKARIWMASDKPLDESLKSSIFPFSSGKDKDRRRLSAGVARPELTASKCTESAFKFLAGQYQKLCRNV